MTGMWGKVAAIVVLVASLASTGCQSCSKDPAPGKSERNVILVLRVESPSPESPGAEHCEKTGKTCRPLAPQQKLAPKGIVRTFAGGKVSLDLGGGRRLDLGSLSETVLSPDMVALNEGDFSVESSPLIQKENIAPLKFRVGDKVISTKQDQTTTSTVSVRSDQSFLTVRRGRVVGLDSVVGFSGDVPQAGQTVRIAASNVYRTGMGGQELAALGPVAPQTSDFGELLEARPLTQVRGLGSMTARLPNTDQVRDGVILKKHRVRVVIRDGFARTEIEEEFANTTPHILEGRYRFPVPGDASLSRLALWVGDELMEGEVLERTRAANIYKSIVDRPVPRDPALLEWVTGGEMSLKVFPILPQKTRRVVLAYNQALSTEGGRLKYVYPLSLGEGRETKVEDLSISVHLIDSRARVRNPRVLGYDAKLGREGEWHTASVQLKEAYPTRDFVFEVERDPTSKADLATYFPAQKKALLPSGIHHGAADDFPVFSRSSRPSGESGYFALRVSADLPEGHNRPLPLLQDRAVVIDISQSQSQQTIVAEAALAFSMIREMGPGEHYVLLACDSACHSFPEDGMQEARGGHLDAARDWLVELSSGGSSDISGALSAGATRLRAQKTTHRDRQLIFIGDGKATSGELSAEGIAQRLGSHLDGMDIRMFAAGRTLDEDTLTGLASRLRATLDHLLTSGPLEERLFELAISLRRPVLREARIELPEMLRSIDSSTLPAIRLGQEILLTGEALGAPNGKVILTGKLADRNYRLEKSLEVVDSERGQNPLVVKLWAQRKIAALQELVETPTTKAEIIDLSTKFRTMSRHTSFLVLENDEMYRTFGVARSGATEKDQVDAAFSKREFSEPSPEESKVSSASSFEELDAESEAPAGPAPHPEPAAAPRAKASAPMSKPKKSSGGLGFDDLSASKDASGVGSGMGTEGAGRIAPDDFIDPEPPRETFRPTVPPLWRAPRRAHLTFSKADDAWRTWGEENLRQAREKLDKDSQSRVLLETFIRTHLQLGRFDVARRAAEDFVKLDPDYAPARQLLAFAAVVDGDHETARKMLDVQVEAAPRDAAAHTESARSFEVVGDLVRACAHYRSLAELAPELEEARQRADACWSSIHGQSQLGMKGAPAGDSGQLEIEVLCDTQERPQDCPSPLAIAPDGRVLSPWTPGTGRSSRSSITFVKLRSGDYHVLVLGGAPGAKGRVVLRGRHENQAFEFVGGSMHTVAKTTVAFF